MKKSFRIMLCIFMLCGLLSGCAVGGESEQVEDVPKEPVTLTLATFSTNPATLSKLGADDYDPSVLQLVEQFNATHTDYQIEVAYYSHYDDPYLDGIAVIQREIVSGEGPDIIDFGIDYSVVDTVGKYTLDLYSFLDEEDYLESVLEAFSYEGGLYAIPVGFAIDSLVGKTSVVGTQSAWTLEEMIACYEKEAAESGADFIMLATAKQVLGVILSSTVGDYVDWETGECSFDNEEFQKLLEFAGSFPTSAAVSGDDSTTQAYLNGEVFVMPVSLASVYDIAKYEIIFGDEVNFIGYPSNGTGNTVINLSGTTALGISIGCDDPEAAWEFISLYFTEEYQESLSGALPVSRSAFETLLESAQTTQYEENADGTSTPILQKKVSFAEEGVIGEIYQISSEQAQQMRELTDRICSESVYDSTLHFMILEEADAYFAGQKSLEETVEIIQSRASIYVNENR
ncbi:MAG: extracellular solute-binding protein [Lachnospiraceae bacterium]|nr:extracellular solute-binding protein [Lachnospiraceae bacterium]